MRLPCINRDENNTRIGGSVQANPNSFVSFLLNELQECDYFQQKLLSDMSKGLINEKLCSAIVGVVNFTQNDKTTNSIRAEALKYFKIMSIQVVQPPIKGYSYPRSPCESEDPEKP